MSQDPYDVLDLKSLKCFAEMAKRLSFTQAGVELGISEAAVSQRVKALERYLGTKLYESRGGRVRLTPAGTRTLTHATTVFDSMSQFQQVISSEEETVELTLCTYDSVLRYMLPDILEQFSARHPLAYLRLLAGSSDRILNLLRTNEADLAISDYIFEGIGGLVHRNIGSCSNYLITARGDPLARRARQDFDHLLNQETLDRYPIIVTETQREERSIAEPLDQLGLKYRVVLEVNTMDTLKHYVARGFGIAAIAGICITEEDLTRLELVRIPEPYDVPGNFVLVTREDKYLTAPLATLIDLIAEASITVLQPERCWR